jgi:L-fuconolactonase
MNGIQALGKFNYTYDILVYADQLQFVPEFAASFPDQKFVLDHIGKPSIKDHNIDEWTKDIMAIAQHENVYCKLSGMVTEANWTEWKNEDFLPYLDTVVEAFGPGNIMFGSDWPVCLVAATYESMLDILTAYFSSFTQNEQDKVFRQNAIQFYNLH